ncbi:MAG: Rieske 2Fe-2S domain-containing protein [Dehalococcoidia bacterium]|jgi:nitrite reductase/ring-hydroxylating ferredoxin subunit
MGTFIVAGNKSDVPAGGMVAVNLKGTVILLANGGGNIYAINNKCPHFGGNLSKGTLNGTIVTCPLHGSQFDITTGKNVRWLKGTGIANSLGKLIKAPVDVMTYKVKIDGNQILVEI